MIAFDRVGFAYGDKAVLRDLTFSVDQGVRLAIRGGSGSGKTTLLRLVMGLEKPTSGTVTVQARRLSPLFQEDRLLPHLTVAQNCALFASDRATVPKLLDALGLKQASDTLPSQLSGGMARRAALARALCHEADLYLFDEPFTGLDDENLDRAASVIRRVTNGKTVLVVTHHEREVEALGCTQTLPLE